MIGNLNLSQADVNISHSRASWIKVFSITSHFIIVVALDSSSNGGTRPQTAASAIPDAEPPTETNDTNKLTKGQRKRIVERGKNVRKQKHKKLKQSPCHQCR